MELYDFRDFNVVKCFILQDFVAVAISFLRGIALASEKLIFAQKCGILRKSFQNTQANLLPLETLVLTLEL